MIHILFQRNHVQIILLGLAAALVYGNTLEVPFYLDDYSSIVENPAIRNISDLISNWYTSPLRFLGDLSFALNYHLHKFSLPGYHLTNIIIHFIAGCGLFTFCRALLRTPALHKEGSAALQTWLPLAAALIFLVHPLQTQAVTYIVQRYASLAAMFYIWSMAFYLKARLTSKPIPKVLFTMGCIAGTGAALLSKQNAVTLPLALLLIEIIFFLPSRRKKIIVTSAIMSACLILFVIISRLMNIDILSLNNLDRIFRETGQISRPAYFLTQAGVIWDYIALFFRPAGLHLDYWVPLAELSPWVAAALVGHGLLIAAAFILRKKQPVIAFSIFFYYLTHFIESGIIPITDLAFEHRTYLPNLALCLLSVWCVFKLFEKLPYPGYTGRGLTVIFIAVTLSLGYLTWSRNSTWQNPVEFWRSNAEVEPNNNRAWAELGKALLKQGKSEEALKVLKKALAVREKHMLPFSVDHVNIININVVIALKNLGRFDEALAYADEALERDMSRLSRGKILVNKGNIYFYQKEYAKAEKCYRKSLEIRPGIPAAYAGLGNILAREKKYGEAEKMFRALYEIDPDKKGLKQTINRLAREKKKRQ